MRKTIKIYWSNGDETITEINGTKEEIEKYYLNNEFNIGNGGNDLIVTAIKVEFLGGYSPFEDPPEYHESFAK